MNKPLTPQCEYDHSFFIQPQKTIEDIEDQARAAVYWPLLDAIRKEFDRTIGAVEYLFENREQLGVQWLQINEVGLNLVRLYDTLLRDYFIDQSIGAIGRYNDWLKEANKRLTAVDKWICCVGDFFEAPRLSAG